MLSRKKKKKSVIKHGLPPGSLVHVGELRESPVGMSVFSYDGINLDYSTPEGLDFPINDNRVTWINIDGVHDTKIMEETGRRFEIHNLILEDVMNTHQRPKVEDFDNYLYVILKMISLSPSGSVNVEQVSLLLGKNLLLSFQEAPGDVFESIRERLRQNRGHVRAAGADYLCYSLIDSIVDNYFLVLEELGERIDQLEERLLNDPGNRSLSEIHDFRNLMIRIRRAVWPLREMIGRINRSANQFFDEKTQLYLRDLYDHTIQVIETVETYREMLAGMLDIYLSSVSNRMNEVMKVLTIIATIFIPLTFIVGVYGMNFKYMPELEWHWGYYFTMGIMLVIASALVVYFRKKEWL